MKGRWPYRITSSVHNVLTDRTHCFRDFFAQLFTPEDLTRNVYSFSARFSNNTQFNKLRFKKLFHQCVTGVTMISEVSLVCLQVTINNTQTRLRQSDTKCICPDRFVYFFLFIMCPQIVFIATA